MRRTTPEQWPELRSLRLRALADSPSAFGSTLAREQALPDDEWQRWARGDSWLAWDDDRAVGMVALVPDDVRADARQVVGMWVAPEVRGTGVATVLVETACAAARGHGAREVALWVADGNDRARRAYARLGFAPTGHRQPLPSDPTVDEQRWGRPVPPE